MIQLFINLFFIFLPIRLYQWMSLKKSFLNYSRNSNTQEHRESGDLKTFIHVRARPYGDNRPGMHKDRTDAHLGPIMTFWSSSFLYFFLRFAYLFRQTRNITARKAGNTMIQLKDRPMTTPLSSKNKYNMNFIWTFSCLIKFSSFLDNFIHII